MTEKTKLILAIQQIDNIVKLTEDNAYQSFIHGHLISIQVELQRQLTLATVFDDGKDPNP